MLTQYFKLIKYSKIKLIRSSNPYLAWSVDQVAQTQADRSDSSNLSVH